MAKSKRKSTPPPRAPELPRLIAPMHPVSGRPFDSEAHLFEVSWCGTRCLAFIEKDSLRLIGRRDVDMRPRYPELACLAKLPSGTVLDGEIVALNRGKPDADKSRQRENLRDAAKIEMLVPHIPVTFMAFDLLWQNYESRTERALLERRAELSALVKELNNPHVIAVDYVIGPGVRYFEAAQRAGLPGVTAKRLDSRYLPGKRSSDWTQIHVAKTDTYDIIGFEQAGGTVLKSILIGERNGRRWTYKARLETGLSPQLGASLLDRLRAAPPLKNPPVDGPAKAQWRNTRLHCRVSYLEKTGIGKLRDATFIELVERDAP